jgi:hypothetical protein
VRLGPRTVEVLEAHRGRQRKERMAAASWEDPGWVFPNTKGKVRRRDSVMRSFRRVLGEAGLPRRSASTTSGTRPPRMP